MKGIVAAGLVALGLAFPAVGEAADSPVAQAGRVEIDVGRGDNWDVMPLGRDGVLLVGDNGADGLAFYRYDADFAPVWSQTWSSPERLWLRDAWVDGGAVWFLLHRGSEAEFTMLRLDVATGVVETIVLVSPMRKTRDVGSLVVQGTDAWLIAASKGELFAASVGSVLHLDLPRREVHMVDLAGAAGVDEMWFDRLTAGPGPHDVSVTATVYEKRHRTLYVSSLSGPMITSTLVSSADPGGDRNLLTGTNVPIGGGDSLLLGTYAGSERSSFASGIFVAGFHGSERKFISYTSFTSFQHFFDYMSERQRERLAARMQDMAEAGEDLDVAYMLRMHAPLVLNDRYVVVAEAYYPHYHPVTTTRTQTVNGVTTTTTTTTQVFDGYLYTHAIVAAFDYTGRLLWDASVPIGNILSPTLRDQVAVQVVGDRIRMLYCVSGKIYSLEADGNEARGVRAEQRLESADEDAAVRTSWGSRSAYWFDDWFLVWGYERQRAEDGAHTVFAFTRVGPG